MSDKPFKVPLGSDEAVLAYLREHCDDIDSMSVPVSKIRLKAPDGKKQLLTTHCVQIKVCSGESHLVPLPIAQALLDEGLLQRRKIPIELYGIEGTPAP